MVFKIIKNINEKYETTPISGQVTSHLNQALYKALNLIYCTYLCISYILCTYSHKNGHYYLCHMNSITLVGIFSEFFNVDYGISIVYHGRSHDIPMHLDN